MDREKNIVLFTFFIFVFIAYLFTDLTFTDSNIINYFHNFYKYIYFEKFKHSEYIIFYEPSILTYSYIYFLYNICIEEVLDIEFICATKETVDYFISNFSSTPFIDKYAEFLKIYKIESNK